MAEANNPQIDKDLKLALGQIEKAFGKGAIMQLGEDAVSDVQGIPTGALSLDLALGGKGLPRGRVIVRHALRNALIAPFTVIMLHVNWLIAGVIVVEFFFAYKGFGSLILEASLGRDLHLLEACTMAAVVIAVGTQTISDVAYTWLNPRIRFK